MTIGRDYMLKTPPGRSGPKRFLDRQIVPLAANLAGGLEVALDRAAARASVRPSVILVCITGLLSFSLLQLLRPRRRVAKRRFLR